MPSKYAIRSFHVIRYITFQISSSVSVSDLFQPIWLYADLICNDVIKSQSFSSSFLSNNILMFKYNKGGGKGGVNQEFSNTFHPNTVYEIK